MIKSFLTATVVKVSRKSSDSPKSNARDVSCGICTKSRRSFIFTQSDFLSSHTAVGPEKLDACDHTAQIECVQNARATKLEGIDRVGRSDIPWTLIHNLITFSTTVNKDGRLDVGFVDQTALDLIIVDLQDSIDRAEGRVWLP